MIMMIQNSGLIQLPCFKDQGSEVEPEQLVLPKVTEQI